MLKKFGGKCLITFVIFIEVILFSLLVIGKGNTALAAVLPSVMTELTNKERESQNLSKLIVNPVLNNAAQAKALDMASKGYFAHTSPEGKTPWYWLGEAGYRYQYAGENLAIKFSDSENVVQAWMKSPTHRENILKGNYTEVGTGVATGFYEGKETIFVAQFYGNQLQNSKVPNPPTQPKIPVKTETPVLKKTEKPVIKKQSTEVLGVEAMVTPVELVVSPKAVTPPTNDGNLFLKIFFTALSFFSS